MWCVLLYYTYNPSRSCLLSFCAIPIFHFLIFHLLVYTVILDIQLLNITMCIGWILAMYAVRVVHIMLAIALITKPTCIGSVLYKFLCCVHGVKVHAECV